MRTPSKVPHSEVAVLVLGGFPLAKVHFPFLELFLDRFLVAVMWCPSS